MKYISPSTSNPDNYTLLAGDIEPGLDSLTMWSSDDNAVVGVRPETIADQKIVLMSPTATRVTPNGDDATGMVGRFDKPFRTPSAALAATPILWAMYMEDYDYVWNVSWFLQKIFLRNSTITGNISMSWLFLEGEWGTTRPSRVTGTITAQVINVADVVIQGNIVFSLGTNPIFRGMVSINTPNGDVFTAPSWFSNFSQFTDFLSNVQSIVCPNGALFSGAWQNTGATTNLTINNIWNIQVAALVTWINSNLTSFRMKDCKRVIVWWVAFTGNVAWANKPELHIDNCNVFCTKIANISGTWYIVKSTNSVIEASDPELLDDSTLAANSITLWSLWSYTNKDWNTGGKIDPSTWYNDTTVISTLTVD